MKFVLGAISLALCVSACNPAYADDTAPVAPAKACETQQQAIDNVINGSASQGFTVKVHAIISGQALPALVKLINDLPPPSDFDADLAVVFEAKNSEGQDDPRNLIVLFKGGCKIAGMMVPSVLYEKVVGSPA